MTLQVTPREVELLTHAMHAKARLSLSLRNPADGNYESELPRVDFEKIESTVQELNEDRQQVIRGRRRTITE